MSQDGKDSKPQEKPPESLNTSESMAGRDSFFTRYRQRIIVFIGSENTTNQRRIIMFVATGILGALVVLAGLVIDYTFLGILFLIPLGIASGIVGILVFEAMFRTRKWLSPKTLIVYVALVFLILSYVYISMLGRYSSWVDYLTTFPGNLDFLYLLIALSIVTGIAYYLIKIYKNESWVIPKGQSTVDASNQPIFDVGPLTFSSWLRKYSHQIMGFIGWYVVATLLSGQDTVGLITTPGTLIFLIIFAVSKKSKGVAGGILIAVALNFMIDLVRGLGLNGLCFVPFYVSIY